MFKILLSNFKTQRPKLTQTSIYINIKENVKDMNLKI